MLICAAGDIRGEVALGVRFEWVLHVGDFGVWPDASRIDKATKKPRAERARRAPSAGSWP